MAYDDYFGRMTVSKKEKTTAATLSKITELFSLIHNIDNALSRVEGLEKKTFIDYGFINPLTDTKGMIEDYINDSFNSVIDAAKKDIVANLITAKAVVVKTLDVEFDVEYSPGDVIGKYNSNYGTEIADYTKLVATNSIPAITPSKGTPSISRVRIEELIDKALSEAKITTTS